MKGPFRRAAILAIGSEMLTPIPRRHELARDH